MGKQATVQTTLKIDISPEGIRFSIEGLDTDLAELIEAAGDFVAEPIEFNSFESSNVVIRSKKVLQFVDAPTS